MIFLVTILISIAGFIPYIMKSISYSMTPYILADDRDILPSGAVKLSAAIWIILVVITIGIIGVLWTIPYMSASFGGMYQELKGNQLS